MDLRLYRFKNLIQIILAKGHASLSSSANFLIYSRFCKNEQGRKMSTDKITFLLNWYVSSFKN
jgi:hypothetical protein